MWILEGKNYNDLRVKRTKVSIEDERITIITFFFFDWISNWKYLFISGMRIFKKMGDTLCTPPNFRRKREVTRIFKTDILENLKRKMMK